MKITDLTAKDIVHCKTEDEANRILNLAHKAGFKWSDKESFIAFNAYKVHGDQTCYDIFKGQYGDCIHYKRFNYNIINSKEIQEMEEIKIEIPEGYEIDKKNSTFERIILKKKEIDLSIHNLKDWFFINIYNNFYIVKGDIFNLTGLYHAFRLDKKEYYKSTNWLVAKNSSNIYEFRKATEEELELCKMINPDPFVTTPKWEDFGRIEGYYITSSSIIDKYSSLNSISSNKNTFPSKEEAEACLALTQLLQWRDKYNEGWKPDWTDNNPKYVISVYYDEILIQKLFSGNKILAFKSREIRNKFLEDFKDLIEIAKPLL